MASLRTHLRQAGSHGNLRFHPDCPVCRHERVAGELHPQTIVSHRTLAALTAGLLAISGAGPPIAAAAPDVDQAGTASPDTKQTDSAQRPDTNPGGQATPATDTSTAQTGGQEKDNDPPDPEPATDPTPATDDTGQTAAARKPASTTQTPTTPASDPAAAAATPATPAAAPAATAGPQITVPPQHPTIEVPDAHSRHHTRPSRPAAAQRPAPVSAETPRELATSGLPSVDATAAAPTAQPGRAARGHRRVHVVMAGESLWTIARDQLPRGAGDAAIAREVHRLWELNKATIATGSPDLLPTGTKLRLR